MFATLLGALPRPPIAADASIDGARRGSRPRPGGGRARARHRRRPARRPSDPVVAWRATARLTDRAVKQALIGPYSAGHVVGAPAALRSADTLARATDLNAVLRALAAAGCPLIEIHEPAAVDDRGRSRRAGALPRRPSTGCWTASTGSHLSLADHRRQCATAAGVETLLAAPYASLAVDLIADPDNWRLVVDHARGPRDRLWRRCPVAADSDDGPETAPVGGRLRGIDRGPRTGPGRAGHGRLPGRPPVGRRGGQDGPARRGRCGSRRRRSDERRAAHGSSRHRAAGAPRSGVRRIGRRRRTTTGSRIRLDS